MSYDFDYYSGNMLRMPSKPIKPTISRNPSAIEAKAWAEALEEYEREMKGYNDDLSFYRREKSALLIKFQDKLRFDYNLSVPAFDVIWAEAWSRGHSSGLHDVYHEFDELYEFLDKWKKVG